MSTVGLTAQETSFPLDNPFLWGSCFHSMDSKSSWGFAPEAAHSFSVKSAYSDPKDHLCHRNSPPLSPSVERHKPSPARLSRKNCLTYLSLTFSPEPSLPSPSEDQPLPPSAHRGSPPHTPGRCAKPLPPLPLHTDSCSQLSLDSDEHFTVIDDSRRLLDTGVRPARFGFGRQSFRIQGKDNRGFSHPQSPHGFCDSQSPRTQTQARSQSPRTITAQPHQPSHLPPQQTNYHQPHQHTPPLQERHNHPQQQALRPEREDFLLCPRQLDRTQRRVRRTQSGPAGSFNKPSFLSQSKRSTYKPEVPPPIPPRVGKPEDPRRWSVEVSYSDDDKPPKLPPRDPLSRGCSRTPSPKTLPLYMNGEMPPTQSFAPDPKYVSYRGLQRQNSEGSPCILPVIVNGQQDSCTHYYLLDGPAPQHSPDSEWEYGGRKKPSVDFV